MPFYLLKGDLVNMNVDCIVNASNVSLKMVEGVGRAIFHKAGDEEMTQACRAFGKCEVGHCVVTPSFNMTNTKAIIHAVAPIFINGKHGEAKNLRSAYAQSLKAMKKLGYHTIAFPLLGASFAYPPRDAYKVAFSACMDYLKENKDDTIYIVVMRDFPNTLDDDMQDKLTQFITENYHGNFTGNEVAKAKDNLNLLNTIREYQKKTETSDDALILDGNLSHAIFNKIVGDPHYIPSKNVCLAFAVAMKLSFEETAILLNSIGYSFVKNNVFDLIVGFYIKSKCYDVYGINNALFKYNIAPLGANF